jgi:hypothetical protein
MFWQHVALHIRFIVAALQKAFSKLLLTAKLHHLLLLQACGCAAGSSWR